MVSLIKKIQREREKEVFLELSSMNDKHDLKKELDKKFAMLVTCRATCF